MPFLLMRNMGSHMRAKPLMNLLHHSSKPTRRWHSRRLVGGVDLRCLRASRYPSSRRMPVPEIWYPSHLSFLKPQKHLLGLMVIPCALNAPSIASISSRCSSHVRELVHVSSRNTCVCGRHAHTPAIACWKVPVAPIVPIGSRVHLYCRCPTRKAVLSREPSSSSCPQYP